MARREGAFERCVKEVSERGGAYDPRAVCATAERRKYGQAELTRRAVAGKKRAARRRGNPTVAEHKADFYRQGFAEGKKERGQDYPVLGPSRASGQGEFMAQRLVDYYGLPASKAGSVAAEFTRGYFDGFHGKRRAGRGRNPTRRGNPPYSIVAKDGHELGLVQSREEAFAEARSLAESRGERVEVVWKGKTGYKSKYFRPKGLRYPYKRGNPAEAARAVSEEFHGRPVKEMKPVTEKRHHHTFLSELGELVYLIILTPDGRRRVTAENFDGALLCSNEDKNQLFIKDGNQSVNLRDFGIKHPHEVEDLGDLLEVAYFTDKHHLGKDGGIADYYHEFSEPLPTVHFYTRDSRLEISGGRYRITGEGIKG